MYIGVAVVSMAFRSVGRLINDARWNKCSSGGCPHGGSTLPRRHVLRQLQQGGDDGRRTRAGLLHLPVGLYLTCSVSPSSSPAPTCRVSASY